MKQNQTALCICNGFSLISQNSSTKSHFTLKNPHMFFSGLRNRFWIFPPKNLGAGEITPKHLSTLDLSSSIKWFPVTLSQKKNRLLQMQASTKRIQKEQNNKQRQFFTKQVDPYRCPQWSNKKLTTQRHSADERLNFDSCLKRFSRAVPASMA